MYLHNSNLLKKTNIKSNYMKQTLITKKAIFKNPQLKFNSNIQR